ncbi:MAG: single-stranded DNA-binding protein [Phascolarctobacterium sp.]|nr:single-stranded DNA-binding protein [Phascolarctobacterium sp.]
MNNVVISGRIEAVIEPFYTDKKLCIAPFTLIVQRPPNNRKFTPESSPEDRYDFIRCVAYGKQATVLATFKNAGKKITVQGRIRAGYYFNKEGKKINTTNVIVNNFEYDGGEDFHDFGSYEEVI